MLLFTMLILQFVFVVAIYCMYAINRVRSFHNDVMATLSVVETHLAKRYYLLLESFSIAKSLLTDDSKLYRNLSKVQANSTPSVLNNIAEQQKKAIHNLKVLADSYKELQESYAFMQLQDKLTAENKMYAESVKRCNKNIAAYNKYVAIFPRNILPHILGQVKKFDLINENTY